ncbi:MAG: YggT family protein [Thermosynechococcaceae cyanobacterium MS004]|nr:YggT family protein [Thermosynechococcaceae cyanobacterium MS004]
MGSTEVLSFLTTGLGNFFQIYFILVVIRVLLTWFPTVNWANPPFSILSQLTDPYLNLFRSLLPPLGGMDFSPMLALFALQIVSGLLTSARI